MADDLDDLLRRAMKSLDDEVPSGYFEALPERALARLEDPMESSSGSGTPPREEDSGLHDIRSLASSTRLRISNKRQSTHPPMSDEDVLASSSAGWKAVALPEPAKMVSLPELEDLPSKREVAKAARAAKKAAKAEPAPRTAEGTAPSERVDPVASPAPAPSPAPKLAPTPAKAPQAHASRGHAVAIGGILLAAAAGVAIFLATQHHGATASAPVQVARAGAMPAPQADLMGQPAPPAPPPAPVEAAPAPDTTAAAPVAAATPVPAPAPVHAERRQKHVASARGHAEAADKKEAASAPAAPVAGAGGGSNGEPKESFQQLLKEAGVDDTKHVAKPVLSRKMLSADDFKSGMDGVSSAAQGCYKGTQGLASIKLVIAPSGKVQRVSVSGMFAGKPEGACVERAVRGATFPPWDGGPQTFRYSYLLAE